MTAVLVYTRSMKNMVPNPDEVPHAKVHRSIFHGWLRRSFFHVVLVFRFRRPQAPEDEARDILCGVILSHVPVVSGRSRLLFCVLPDCCPFRPSSFFPCEKHQNAKGRPVSRRNFKDCYLFSSFCLCQDDVYVFEELVTSPVTRTHLQKSESSLTRVLLSRGLCFCVPYAGRL